jgi:hypothetical protein
MYGGAVMKTRFNIVYGSDYNLNLVISEGTGKYNMKNPMKIDPKRLVLPLSTLFILIYTISLPIKPAIKLNIHNQCPNVDLISPTYIADSRSECYRIPDHKVCAGDAMRSAFTIDKLEDEYNGALICKLQRRQSYESTKISEDASSVVQLLVVWNFSKFELHADILLVEYGKRLDKDHLKELCHKNVSNFRLYPVPITETWLLDDNTALMISFKVMNGGQLLNVTISEVDRDNVMRTPVHIDSERCVALGMMIAVIMLIYAISLSLQLPSCMNIFNLCSNTELVSPVYFGNGAVCSKLSGQQIDIGTKMRAYFEIKATQDEFEGALLFKLQRYSNSQHNVGTSTTETNENETTYVYMLAAWKVENSGPLVRVALVEHVKAFTWNKDKLKKLYDKNHNFLKKYDDTTSYTWLIDEITALKMSFKTWSSKESFELSITISEEKKNNYAMRPFRIDLER